MQHVTSKTTAASEKGTVGGRVLGSGALHSDPELRAAGYVGPRGQQLG